MSLFLSGIPQKPEASGPRLVEDDYMVEAYPKVFSPPEFRPILERIDTDVPSITSRFERGSKLISTESTLLTSSFTSGNTISDKQSFSWPTTSETELNLNNSFSSLPGLYISHTMRNLRSRVNSSADNMSPVTPSSDPVSPVCEALEEAGESDDDADSEDAWNLIPYDISWGSSYYGYREGTLPGPDGKCIFLRSPTPLRFQRTGQACEKCRERKAKCSGTRPSCARCISRGLACEYAPEPRRSNPEEPEKELIASSPSGCSSPLGHRRVLSIINKGRVRSNTECGPREVRVRHTNNSILRRRHSAIDMTSSSISLRRMQRLAPREIKSSKFLTTDVEAPIARHNTTLSNHVGDILAVDDNIGATQPVEQLDQYQFLPSKEIGLSCFSIRPSIQITADGNTDIHGLESSCNWNPCLPEDPEVGGSAPKNKVVETVLPLGYDPQVIEQRTENADHIPPMTLRPSTSMPDLGYAHHHIQATGSETFSSIDSSHNLGGSTGSTGFSGSSSNDLNCNMTNVPCDDSFHGMDVWPYESAVQANLSLKSEVTDFEFCFPFDVVPPHIAILDNPSDYYPFN